MSSAAQSPLRPQVAYLGPIASFSHQAALEYFDDTADLHPHPSFASIFNALQTSTPTSTPTSTAKITHAIVPIENSSNGTVVSLLDLLADPENKYPSIKVCAEHYLAVHHCLLAAPTPSSTASSPQTQTLHPSHHTIKTLHTHPQVWTQCTTYLSTHLSHAERIDTSSTSAAAAHLLLPSTPSNSAAIGSALAAETLGLNILARNIEDDGSNTTRFLVLYNDSTSTSSPLRTPTLLASPSTSTSTTPPPAQPLHKHTQKSLLTFTLSHSLPGSLSLILSTFSTHNFNLTSIDTRPSRRIPWHYIFCVECEEVEVDGSGKEHEEGPEGGQDFKNFERMLETLRSRTETVRYLGSWEDALRR